MIGIRAFLVELAFPLVPLLILLAIAASMLRSKNTRRSTAPSTQASFVKPTATGIIVIVIVAVGVVFGGLRLVRQARYHLALHDLNGESLESVQVGNTTLRNRAAIEGVVRALRDSRWYRPTAGDGGWTPTVELVIRFKSGGEQRYQVGRKLKTPDGAVIDFISQDPNSQFVGHYGYAYAEQLPEVLDHAGASLTAKSDKQ